MREILFRGFHPDENGSKTITLNGKKIKGEWIEGGYIPNSSTMVTATEERKGILKFKYSLIYPETVGLYIGKNDKNGNKIFTNDKAMFTYGDNKVICTVVFEHGAFGLVQHQGFNYHELELNVLDVTGNQSKFMENDNFISLWEIAWNYCEESDTDLSTIEVIGNKW